MEKLQDVKAMSNNQFSKTEFLQANKDRELNNMDYIHAIYSLSGLHSDFALSFSKLFVPEIRVFDGNVILSEFYYDDSRRGLLDDKNDNFQFWFNLVEITGIFEEMSVGEAEVFGDNLVLSWNYILKDKFPTAHGKARRITDIDMEEVFITID